MWFQLIGLALSLAGLGLSLNQGSTAAAAAPVTVNPAQIANENMSNMNAFADDQAVTNSLIESENTSFTTNRWLLIGSIALGIFCLIKLKK